MNPKCQRNSGKDHSGRRNPVYVSRVLSAMVTLIPHTYLTRVVMYSLFTFFNRKNRHLFFILGISLWACVLSSHIRSIVMMIEVCCWADGAVTMREASIPCPGGAAWRFCAPGTNNSVCRSDTDSAGCLRRSPVRVR